MAHIHMERAGRVKDILLFLHRQYLMTGEWQTVGEYARFANISKSPHLRSMFKQMEDEQLIMGCNMEYKATVVRIHKIHYENVTKSYPHIRQILMEIDWQEGLI